jgi:hypothetical protein
MVWVANTETFYFRVPSLFFFLFGGVIVAVGVRTVGIVRVRETEVFDRVGAAKLKGKEMRSVEVCIVEHVLQCLLLVRPDEDLEWSVKPFDLRT